MLKKTLALISFLFLFVTVWIQSQELLLQYFVLFPALFLPVVFFREDFYRRLFLFALGVVFLMFLFFLARYPSMDMAVLGGGGVGFFFVWLAYEKKWVLRVVSAETENKKYAKELLVLQQKHQARLESLHHLEKQVSGLLDLYEIARDFNDYLSYDGMAEILFQRVLPELPFKTLKLVIMEKSAEAGELPGRVFKVHAQGFEEKTVQEGLSKQEAGWIEKANESRRMLQEPGCLIFPMNSESELSAYMIIEGSQPDDLAKFEVLAAYTALQVRKVKLYQTVKDLAIRDSLTGFLVRRHFMERFHEEMKRSLHYNLPLAVLILDIDHFKRYNDDYGHLAGDATLKQVAALLRENLRKVDLVSRYGGEEFVIVVPETRKAIAVEIGERIRSSIARHNFKVFNDQTRVTVSIGISLFPEDIRGEKTAGENELAVSLVQYADQALYRAKEEGRNRVILYQDLSKSI